MKNLELQIKVLLLFAFFSLTSGWVILELTEMMGRGSVRRGNLAASSKNNSIIDNSEYSISDVFLNKDTIIRYNMVTFPPYLTLDTFCIDTLTLGSIIFEKVVREPVVHKNTISDFFYIHNDTSSVDTLVFRITNNLISKYFEVVTSINPFMTEVFMQPPISYEFPSPQTYYSTISTDYKGIDKLFLPIEHIPLNETDFIEEKTNIINLDSISCQERMLRTTTGTAFVFYEVDTFYDEDNHQPDPFSEPLTIDTFFPLYHFLDTIVIFDTIPPRFTNIPPDETIQCNSFSASDYTVSVQGNCDTEINLQFNYKTTIDVSGNTVHSLEWAAQDIRGNTSFTTTIITESACDATIFPNPATNNVFVNLGNFSTLTIELKVYDLSSKEVYNQVLSNDGLAIKKISLSNLTNGLYYLVLSSKNGVFFSEKIMINNR